MMDDADDGVWLFDGVCNFCSGSVRLVFALDRKGAVRFTPVQSPYGRRLAERHGLNPDDPLSFLFIDGGRALAKSEAVIALARRLSPPLRWVGPLVGVLPRRWRDSAYDWIAANRYRLLGRRRTCLLPTPEQRARFILE